MTTNLRTLILAMFASGLFVLGVGPESASAKSSTDKAKPTVVAQAKKSSKQAKPVRKSAAKAKASKPAKKKLKRIDFGEGDDVEGGVHGPKGDTIQSLTPITHSSLIRLREDFLPEIFKSAETMP